MLVPDDDEPTRSSCPPPPAPALLEYQSPEAEEPDLTRRRAVTLWSIALMAGWIPFACGVVNALVAAQKYYSPAIVSSHFPASLIFMALGALTSLLTLIGFLRLRHPSGMLAAGAVLLAQIAMATCLGLA